MLYDKLPRPTTNPDALARARALLGAAQRRQNLFAQALNQADAEPNGPPTPGPRANAPADEPGASLDNLVKHIAQASDQDLAGTHRRLQQARAKAQGFMAADSELAGLMASAYGASPGHAGAEVVDVVAREVLPDSALPPGETAPRE